jgi:hypothetical protein
MIWGSSNLSLQTNSNNKEAWASRLQINNNKRLEQLKSQILCAKARFCAWICVYACRNMPRVSAGKLAYTRIKWHIFIHRYASLAGTQFNGNTVTVQGWINCSIYRKLVQYAAPENIPNTKGNIVNILDQRGVRMLCYSSIICQNHVMVPFHYLMMMYGIFIWKNLRRVVRFCGQLSTMHG